MAFKKLNPAGSPCPALKTYPNGSDPRQMFWNVIANLKTAKRVFGLKDRHFGLLQALVSFVRERESSGAWVVFASNEKLCERANEMGERTMRRHIARLVEVGLLRRSQSPNGKRYVHRSRDGQILQAYGFDLGPLLERADEITLRAAEVEEETARIRLLRDRLSTLRREWPIGSDQDNTIRLALRRQLTETELTELIENLSPERTITLPSTIPQEEYTTVETEVLSPDAGQNDRHHQKSKQINIDSDNIPSAPDHSADTTHAMRDEKEESDLTMGEVLKACPEALSFAQKPLQNWTDLHLLARFLAPMLGLRREILDRAEQELGQGGTTLTLLAITQMHGSIRSPGAYLRSLIAKSAAGRFDPVRLIRMLGKQTGALSTA